MGLRRKEEWAKVEFALKLKEKGGGIRSVTLRYQKEAGVRSNVGTIPLKQLANGNAKAPAPPVPGRVLASPITLSASISEF